MRRILLFITFISFLISNMGISGVFAAVDGPDTVAYEQSLTNNPPATTTTASNSTTSSTSSKNTVITTEQIPGANCTCIADGAQGKTEAINDGDRNRNVTTGGSGEAACNNITTRKYSCEVTSGMSAFQGIMGTLIKWFIYIIMLLGVLAIVGAGIMMTFGSDSEEYTKKAKGWAMNIVIGLVILFTFSYILKILAPWIYQ